MLKETFDASRLSNLEVGFTEQLTKSVRLQGKFLDGFKVVDKKNSATSPLELEFYNCQGDSISALLKKEDLLVDYVVMRMIRYCGEVWSQNGFEQEPITYSVFPFDDKHGLIELVQDCKSFGSLKRNSTSIDDFLQKDPQKIKKLADTTAFHLAVCYLLGVRDNHEDNIMLMRDGSLFRVDFGWVFGWGPWIDAPPLALPEGVIEALRGAGMWDQVEQQSHLLVRSILGSNSGSDELNIHHQHLILGCEGFQHHDEELFDTMSRYIRSVSMKGFQHAMEAALTLTGSMRKKLKDVTHNANYGPRQPASQSIQVATSEYTRARVMAAVAFSEPFFAVHCVLLTGAEHKVVSRYAQRCLSHRAVQYPDEKEFLVRFLAQECSLTCPPEKCMQVAFSLLKMELVHISFESLKVLAKRAVDTRHEHGTWCDFRIPLQHVMILMVLSARGSGGIKALSDELAKRVKGQAVLAPRPSYSEDGPPLRNLLAEIDKHYDKNDFIVHLRSLAENSGDKLVEDMGVEAFVKLGPLDSLKNVLGSNLLRRIEARLPRARRKSSWAGHSWAAAVNATTPRRVLLIVLSLCVGFYVETRRKDKRSILQKVLKRRLGLQVRAV